MIFTSEPIEVKEDATETLVLALDAFIQQFRAKLSFTTDGLSFEGSAHRTATGIADLGSAHLLASKHITSARFALIVDLDYDNIAQSEQSMQQFLLAFVDAVAQDLSCENDFVRVTFVERSKKRERKAEWTPILSYLQLQPFDFDPKHNYDYTKPDVPAELMRGDLPYYLPIGWFRHALKVDNKYKDGSAWLGSSNGPGEWPVVFHGTKSKAVKGITDQGLLVSSVKTDLMSHEAMQQKGEEVNRPGLNVATHCNGGSHPFLYGNVRSKNITGKNRWISSCFPMSGEI
ncbi:unnamed protein product [Rotaria sp. Silwood2]|nr:unnamed protein product [Rotaria sp. Silwood2]